MEAQAIGSRAEKKQFYKKVLRMMIPISLQNFMDAAVGSADVLMLTLVSQAAISASSLAGQVTFILSSLMYGITSGASVLAAQYWGKGDRRTIERVMAMTIRVATLISLLFALAAWFIPETLMSFFTPDPELIEAGVLYLKAVALSYVCSGFINIYLGIMRSIERVRMSALVHSSAVVLNVVLNACFIFGWGPFPSLGITGVALATSITRVVETLICIVDSMRCKEVKLRVKDFLRRNKVLMGEFLRYSAPAAMNDIVWSLATSIYSVILGHLSSDIVAANSVASIVRNLGTVVCFGMSSCAAIMLGKAMGDNKLAEARAYAPRFLMLSIVTALAGSVVILCCRPLVLQYMYIYVEVTDIVRQELSTMLLINSYYIVGMSMNTMMVCGIFRAGGDVNYGFICDTIAMWGYAVPVGLLAAFVLKLPEMWVYFILCLDEFVKMPAFFIHFKRGKWIKNITRDDLSE